DDEANPHTHFCTILTESRPWLLLWWLRWLRLLRRHLLRSILHLVERTAREIFSLVHQSLTSFADVVAFEFRRWQHESNRCSGRDCDGAHGERVVIQQLAEARADRGCAVFRFRTEVTQRLSRTIRQIARTFG